MKTGNVRVLSNDVIMPEDLSKFENLHADMTRDEIIEKILDYPIVTQASDQGKGWHSEVFGFRGPRIWKAWLSDLAEAHGLTTSQMLRAAFYVGMRTMTLGAKVEGSFVHWWRDVTGKLGVVKKQSSKVDYLLGILNETSDMNQKKEILRLAKAGNVGETLKQSILKSQDYNGVSYLYCQYVEASSLEERHKIERTADREGMLEILQFLVDAD